MIAEEDRPYSADAPSGDPDMRPGMALPQTIYVWLVLLILAFAAPAVIPQNDRRVASGREATLTATEFADLASAETTIRAAFGLDASQRALGSLGDMKSLGPLLGTNRLEKQRTQSLKDGEKTFRKLETSLHTPGLVRQVFVVQHALGEKLDPTLLNKDLPDNLKQAKKTPGEIATEQRFWRSLYGDSPSIAARDVPDFVTLVHGMNLHFLEDRVLSDLYSAAGDKKQAAAYQSAFDQKMLRSTGNQFMLGLYILIVVLAGLIFLILFLVAARTGNWRMVMRTEPRPQPAGWGDLLDVFAFYLAAIKVFGLIVAMLAARTLTEPSPNMVLLLQTSVYVGTGLLALGYLFLALRRRGAALADIGLRAPRGIFAEIGYGIAGYCAALPIVLVLGLISHLLFQHDQTRTPNPILPLIAVANDPVGRIVIFLLVSFGAPFFEELFFRGVLFSGLRTRYSWVVSATLSGMVFAMVHPMQDWLPIFGLGFALATMREMRQSLVPGMTAHFMQNTLAFVSMSLLFGS